MIGWLLFLFRVRETLDSNPCSETYCLDWGFQWPSAVGPAHWQNSALHYAENISIHIISKISVINHSIIDAILYEPLTASLNKLLLLSALQLFASFGLLNYLFPLLPLLRPLFPIGHPHFPQIIPHIFFPSYSWPSLQSCCIRFPFVYGLSHYNLHDPTSSVVFILYILLYFHY